MPNINLTTADKPNDRLWMWVMIAIAAVIGLMAMSFWFDDGVLPYLLVIFAAMVIVTIAVPRSFPVSLARLAAFVLTFLLIFLLWGSGLPLAIAEFFTPVAQHLQDEGGNLGSSANLVWLVVVVIVMLVLMTLSVVLYWTEVVPLILLSAFVLPLASMPLLGVISQEMARNPH